MDADEAETIAFEDAKRIILHAIMECVDQGIDAALVSAVLIGSGVSWYSRFHGDHAVVQVLSQTIEDIRTGRHRSDRWVQ